jgi:hypothetical protein
MMTSAMTPHVEDALTSTVGILIKTEAAADADHLLEQAVKALIEARDLEGRDALKAKVKIEIEVKSERGVILTAVACSSVLPGSKKRGVVLFGDADGGLHTADPDQPRFTFDMSGKGR